MGNRGTVVFVSPDGGTISPAIYMHWNGGPDSVYLFLDELDRRKARNDANYEAARFVQIVGEFFDSGDVRTVLSLGITNGPKEITKEALSEVETDHGDNGFYVVTRFPGQTPKRRVRRFLGWGGLRELTPEVVAKEEKDAYEGEDAKDAEKFWKPWGDKPPESD